MAHVADKPLDGATWMQASGMIHALLNAEEGGRSHGTFNIPANGGPWHSSAAREVIFVSCKAFKAFAWESNELIAPHNSCLAICYPTTIFVYMAQEQRACPRDRAPILPL